MSTGKHHFVRFLDKIMGHGLESFNRYYSMYRAIVHNVEDPEFCQRLQLIIPDLTAELPYEYWASPKDVYSGKGYGTQTLPRKGDVVWVEFELGDCQHPIWSHGYPGTDDVPKEEELKDYTSHWHKSPKGHMVLIDDTNNVITINHASGQSVMLTDKGVSLVSDKSVSLGSEDKSAEPALLGDKTEELLDNMKTILTGIYTALNKDVLTSTSSSSPFLMFTNLASELPQHIESVVKLEVQLKKIKSKIVNLD